MSSPAPGGVDQNGGGLLRARTPDRQATRSAVHSGVLPETDRREGPREDLQIHPQRVSFDIQPIEPHLLREDSLDVIVQEVIDCKDLRLVGEGKLREASDTWPDTQNLRVLFAMQADEVWILGTRPNEAHPSAQDVPELRD